MAVPRPVLLALLGFALIVSALLATRDAVRGIRGTKGVAVFNAGVDQLALYRPILANVGVSQVPAVVVVRPGHKAQLLEGFIDKSSLRQAVADAQR